MKKSLLIICLFLISAGGCNAMVTRIDKPSHQFAWACEGKSISEVRRVVDECILEVYTSTPNATLFQRCMNLKGYFLYPVAELKSKQYSIQKTRWSAGFFYNDVAGKTK